MGSRRPASRTFTRAPQERVFSSIDLGGTDMARTVSASAPAVTSNPPPIPTPRAGAALLYAVKRHEGGIAHVAQQLRMSADVLQKKLSPTCETHVLTLDEAQNITALIGDPAAAIEFARAAGLICFPMPSAQDSSLHKSMSDVAKEFSDVMAEFAEATRDNMISTAECDRMHQQMVELVVACGHLLDRMRPMAGSRDPVVEASH